ARETLSGSSKDLLVAARLVEALTREHGYRGLRDGLRLMRRLVSECWDRLQPSIESEDDMGRRAAPFSWLAEADRGARSPNALRMVRIIGNETTGYSWNDGKQSQSGRGGATAAVIDKAVKATPLEDCQTTLEDLSEAGQELDALTEELNSRMAKS